MIAQKKIMAIHEINAYYIQLAPTDSEGKDKQPNRKMGQKYGKQITDKAIQKINKYTLTSSHRYESVGLKRWHFSDFLSSLSHGFQKNCTNLCSHQLMHERAYLTEALDIFILLTTLSE